MIFTTYFAKIKYLPQNVIPISICAKVPCWYEGIQYRKLAPKYEFFQEWKRTRDNAYYIEHFSAEVLDTLNFYRVLDDLQVLIPDWIKRQMQEPFWRSDQWHIALVCYEKPSDFCHRHLVSDWFCRNGVDCRELTVIGKNCIK